MLQNYLFDNGIVFYGLFAATTLFIGYYWYSASLYNTNNEPTNSIIDKQSNDLFYNTGSETSSGVVTPAVNRMETVYPSSHPGNLDTDIVDMKFAEIKELFSDELAHSVITDTDLYFIINSFTIPELLSGNINEVILRIIDSLTIIY